MIPSSPIELGETRNKNQVISTADAVSIDPSESRQPSVPDTDTRNLIIAQQARRIQELEIEISELKRARHDAAENVIGGGYSILPCSGSEAAAGVSGDSRLAQTV